MKNLKNKKARKITGVLMGMFLSMANVYASPVELDVDADHPGIHISPDLYGIFFEDINHAADGGLYAELVRNRSFEDAAQKPVQWNMVINGDAEGKISLEKDRKNLLNTAQKSALKLNVTKIEDSAEIGVSNEGFWGIGVKADETYDLSFFAKANEGFDGTVTALLESADGQIIYGKTVIPQIGAGWEKHTAKITANANDPTAKLVLLTNKTGTLWFDVVSLFPPTFNNRPQGLRSDLGTLVKNIKPKFMRFPGGCFVEGDYMDNAFRWKQSLGKIEERPGHYNLWQYRTTDGIGYHEYLQFCEDIGATPLFVANVGIAHGDNIPLGELQPWIQDALDAIEYANGDVTTKYGAMRAANGHPAPFNLKYIEIGNENNQHDDVDNRCNLYGERYRLFYNAIKEKYPEIKTIGNVEAWGTDTPSWQYKTGVDLLDEHYYRSTQWFIDMAKKYDTYNRKGPGIYIGEYAVTSPADCGTGSLNAAIGEAAFMTGLERNSDVVKMASYAPLFVNANNRFWNPDAIVYNSEQAYGTPSYYVQKMFANNVGDVVLPTKLKTSTKASSAIENKDIMGKIGIGTWNTAVEYDDVKVISNVDKSTLFSDDFSAETNTDWKKTSGEWTQEDGTFNEIDTGAAPAMATTGSDRWLNYTMTLKATKTAGNEGMMIYFGMVGGSYYDLNLGGWGNTMNALQKCVNGNTTIMQSKPGKISTGKNYTIKINISGNTIKAYVNDELLFNVTDTTPIQPAKRDALYYVTSQETATGDIIIKVVNPNNKDQETTINIDGSKHIEKGTAMVLTSNDIMDENSFDNPTKISPVEKVLDITSTANAVTYNFPKNSITVLRLKTK